MIKLAICQWTKINYLYHLVAAWQYFALVSATINETSFIFGFIDQNINRFDVLRTVLDTNTYTQCIFIAITPSLWASFRWINIAREIQKMLYLIIFKIMEFSCCVDKVIIIDTARLMWKFKRLKEFA